MSSQRHVTKGILGCSSQPFPAWFVCSVPGHHTHSLGPGLQAFSMDVQTLGSFVNLESIRGPAHEGHKTNKQTTRAHGVPGLPCWGPRLPTGELDSPPTEETGKGSTVLLTRRALSEEQTPRDQKPVFYSTSAGDCYSAPQFLDE